MSRYHRSTGLYTIKAGEDHKVIASEPTIGDVCADCNNGVLSRLDEYGSSLYSEYFAPFPIPGKLIKFNYDYDLLFRWLLKLWFNQWRARNWTKAFGAFPPSLVAYIRTGAPPAFELNLFVQVLRATPIRAPSDDPAVTADYNENGFNPCIDRFGIAHPDAIPGFGPGMVMALRSFCFYGFFGLVGAPKSSQRKIMLDFVKQTHGAYKLARQEPQIKLYVSTVDHVSAASQSPPFRRNLKLRNQFVGKRN